MKLVDFRTETGIYLGKATQIKPTKDDISARVNLVGGNHAGLSFTKITICRFFLHVFSRLESTQFFSHHPHHKELYNHQSLFGIVLQIDKIGQVV